VTPPAEWIPGRSEKTQPEPEPEPEPEPVAVAAPEPVAAREPEPQPEPVAVPPPETEPVAARDPEPEPQPESEPVDVAAREPEPAPVREPQPDRSELLAAIAAAQWTCELTWTANLRSAGFRAKATAAGERDREAARSGKLNHPPLVPPAPEPELIRPARAVARALVRAGWTPTTRGDHWYSQRFAWTHDGEPPELGAIEDPQATVRNLRRGRPSRKERTTA
jgi:hypothetical protein